VRSLSLTSQNVPASYSINSTKEYILLHSRQQDNNSSSKLMYIIQEVGAPTEIQNSILADNWLIVAVLTSFSITIFNMGMVVMGGDILSGEYLCLSCRDTYHLHMYVCTYVHLWIPMYLHMGVHIK